MVTGLCLYNLERFADALIAFRSARELDPKNINAQVAAGTCLLR